MIATGPLLTNAHHISNVLNIDLVAAQAIQMGVLSAGTAVWMYGPEAGAALANSRRGSGRAKQKDKNEGEPGSDGE